MTVEALAIESQCSPGVSLNNSTDRLIGVIGLATEAGVSVADFIRSVSEELTEQTVFEDWPKPQSITVKIEPLAYPLESLPPLIHAAVMEVADFVKAPLPMVAGCALSAMSLSLQGHIDIKRAERLLGPSSLFSLNIADSGERKSTCDQFFTSAIRQHEAEQAELLKPVVTEYKAALSAWQSQREGILSAIKTAASKGAVPDRLKFDLSEHESLTPEAPRVPRIILGDETPESLAWSLAKVWPSSGVLSSEAGTVLGGHAMGSDSAMRNLALLNILWDGGVQTIGRKTSESFTMQGVRLTVGLQIQEATLRAFLTKSGDLARGTGFLARFLVSWPESTQGTRKFTEAPTTWPKLSIFHRRISEILNVALPVTEAGSLSPKVIELSTDAKKAWVAFHDEIEADLGKGGVLFDVRDVASKTADNAARLAALFQSFETSLGSDVSAEHFERASQIVTWHLSESRRFFGELALGPELSAAAKLDSWLIEYCKRENKGVVLFRFLQQYGPRALRTKAALEAAAIDLMELDRIRIDDQGRQRAIKVNPELLGQ